MSFVVVSKEAEIATVTLSRGKVNALNELMVEQIDGCLTDLEEDPAVKGIILTGQGKFFSFGFDIPEFLSYSRDAFTVYLTKFTKLYTHMFVLPKPLVAALNGHAIAGGCMLATACDYRLMVSGKAKISLNEITFGASVFAGSVEILKFCVGQCHAETVLGSGAMYSAGEAHELGLVDRVSTEETLKEEAEEVARDLANKDVAAFRSIKALLRQPVADEMVKREAASIREFVDIWYSEQTRKQLEQIKIRA
jgi:enoyl-CoA hydratase/carnithine racemase